MKIAQFWNWLTDPNRAPLVMGVLNITPDSFSDGGQFRSPDEAARQAIAMVEAGADLIDIGGESSRPGSLPVPADEQIRRVVPTVRAVAAGAPGTVLSVDTTRAAVAEAALDAGAHVINDISAFRDDPALLPLCAARRAPVVIMHMLGTPHTMQNNPTYADVVADVRDFLAERTRAAVAAGVPEHHIVLDPGIGFGKTMVHNLELLRRLPELTSLGRPLLVGTSRKKFIGTLTGEPEPARRVMGTAATVAWSVANGAAIVRVHDVRPMVQVVAMIRAIQHGPPGGLP